MRSSREGGRAPDEAVASPADVPGANGNDGLTAALAFGSDPLLAALERRRSWFLVRHEYRRARMASSLLVDKLFSIKTTPVEDNRALGSATPGDLVHRPTGWLTLWRVFRYLHRATDGAILDVGSGAGRAVLVASTFPFRHVIGLEALEPMHRLASDNLGRFRLPRRVEIQLVLGDATRYDVPDDVPGVFFTIRSGGLHSPGGPSASPLPWTASPRRLIMAYHNPVEHERLIGTGRCRLVGQFRGLRLSDEWAWMLATYFYEVRPGWRPEHGGAGTAEMG